MISESVFTLKVIGDSMTSSVGLSVPEGYTIIVDPQQRDCSLGDLVIAKIIDGDGVTFKQLKSDGTRHYLKPLNPSHPPIFDEFQVLGKVIQINTDYEPSEAQP